LQQKGEEEATSSSVARIGTEREGGGSEMHAVGLADARATSLAADSWS